MEATELYTKMNSWLSPSGGRFVRGSEHQSYRELGPTRIEEQPRRVECRALHVRLEVVAGLLVEDVVEVEDELQVEPALLQREVLDVLQIQLIVRRRAADAGRLGVAVGDVGAGRERAVGLDAPCLPTAGPTARSANAPSVAVPWQR